VWLSCVAASVVAAAISPVTAAVSDLAAEFSRTSSTGGNWTYGYLSSNGSFNQDADNLAILATGATPGGFVAYDTFAATGGPGGGWTTGLGFPFTGQWNVPENPIVYQPGGGPLTDWPSAAGDNPDYPHGILGGHSPNTPFTSGWYAVRYTAPSSGPIDLEMKSWQVAVYPDVPPNPAYGGATRPQQVRIDKSVGGVRTNLFRATNVTRHGIFNYDGTPEHTAHDSPTPGVGGFYATQQEEIDKAIRDSQRPNLYRLTNVNLNAGESIIISYAAQSGLNFTGYHGLNVIVRSGADRIATTRWDLSDDWNVTGTSATDIGPDAAWSYGILKNGSFAAYDRIHAGYANEDVNTPERESTGWGTREVGWFVAGVPDPETGPIVPGMMKDADGFNMTTINASLGEFSGDWPGGAVAIHTPPSDVDAAQTSVFRWRAPRNMTVDANGGMWRLTLPDATDRRHKFELRKGATVLASGTIDELGFGATDTNSANPEAFNVGGIAVVTGDILELRIAPLSSGPSLTADFDNNGVVDGADFTEWKGDFGAGLSGSDFLAWQREFGATGGGGSASPGFIGVDFTVKQSGTAALVPEPTSCGILAVALAGLTARRRKR